MTWLYLLMAGLVGSFFLFNNDSDDDDDDDTDGEDTGGGEDTIVGPQQPDTSVGDGLTVSELSDGTGLLSGSAGGDLLDSDGLDAIESEIGYDVSIFQMGDGDDSVSLDDGLPTILGQAGNDLITVGGYSHIEGGSGNDTINLDDTGSEVFGGSGDDDINADIVIEPESVTTADGLTNYVAIHDTAIDITGGAGGDMIEIDATLNYVQENEGDEPDLIATITGFDPREDLAVIDIVVNPETSGDLGAWFSSSDFTTLSDSGATTLDGPTSDHSLVFTRLETAFDNSYTDVILTASGTAADGTEISQELAVRLVGLAQGTSSFVAATMTEDGLSLVIRQATAADLAA
ncbi:hypothetical protein [Salipiger sp.]|uniref:hypothetical protein n=1 Tax=Salipiger sp. TaxID=2078585 RepID=UPI003A987D59